MTVELREFIEARLGEDEAMARSASGGPWRVYAERGAQHLEEDPVTGWRISTATGGDSESVVAGLPMQAELDVSGGGVRIGALLWREAGPSPQERNAEHIARHDPARVLREVEAKRRLLVLHAPDVDGDCSTCCGGSELEVLWDGDEETVTEARRPLPSPCPSLLVLALPYAAHPDYNPSWSPESVVRDS